LSHLGWLYAGWVKNVVETTARSLGVRILLLESPGGDEPDRAFSAVAKEPSNALLVLFDPLLTGQRVRIAALANKHRLPVMCPHREYAEAGGLMAYGASLLDLYRRAATYVDRILKSARPADLPIEQPTRFELVIDLKTAKALGLIISPSLLGGRTRSFRSSRASAYSDLKKATKSAFWLFVRPSPKRTS
jgi:putative ABC transport system substrate-binding protein